MPRTTVGPTGRRTTVRAGGTSRYVRRNASGKFTEDQVKAGG
jgi:hypothetical protein